ncbi:MAG: (d)CMP kinase [Verrucomicrobiota bacterium]
MTDASEFIIVAMDGGAATGKSSTSRALAEKLDLMHVDTGAHYRTLTYALLSAGADANDPQYALEPLANLKIDTELKGRSAMLSINGVVPEDAQIRSPEVNAAVSSFAAISAVRQFLFDYQRQQAGVAFENGFQGLIMEGRDIGSVIFPDANFRFFLHADEATRAARRAKEGQTDSIAARDKMDTTRKTAPMVCPEGATRVDTGPLTLEEVVATIAATITKKD